jgi:transposase InsO family protein
LITWTLARALLRAVYKDRVTLVAENLALRQQLIVLHRRVPRPPIDDGDRAFWVNLVSLWSGWRSALLIVRPATVVRWHRMGFRWYWRFKCRPGGGRPKIPVPVRQLTRRMSRANPLWGAPRIRAELVRIGIEVSEATVARYRVRVRKPPSATWRAFLDNHARELVAIDFFVVPTVGFKLLWGFVVLSHDRRRIVHVNATANPSARWTAQQIRDAFPWDEAPRFLLRDNDQIYGVEFERALEAMGIADTRTAKRSPWQNSYCERVIGTIRRECTDHVIVFSEDHLRRVLRKYAEYYNTARTHQSLDGDAPDGRAVEFPPGDIVEVPMVGGLHHRYTRRAA